MKNFVGGLILVLSLWGCSPSEDSKTSSDNQHKALSNAVNQPLEKARGSEKQIFESAERQKKQAEDL